METIDVTVATARQQSMWGTGDWNQLALQFIPAADALLLALDPHPGERVLDVACGSGNAALLAARRHCRVAGVDFVPALLERARARASAEGIHVEFREGDAQALPVADRSFDVVMSTFGVMFAPDQEKAARELVRVAAPGARIGLANWTPEDYGGEFFVVVGEHVPPPPDLRPPVRWGTESGLQELLGPLVEEMILEPRTFMTYYRDVDHALEMYSTYFGPTVCAFESLDAHGRKALRAALAALFAKYNRATDGTLAIECRYLQVVARVPTRDAPS